MSTTGLRPASGLLKGHDSGNPCDSDPGSNSQVNTLTVRVPFVMEPDDFLSLSLSVLYVSRPQRRTAREEASERLHALHEGNETPGAAGGTGEGECRHQPHPGTQGESLSSAYRDIISVSPGEEK